MEIYETDEAVHAETPSFAIELAKSFVLSAAATAGMMAGFVAIGAAMNETEAWKKRRAIKKSTKLKKK